MKNYTYQSFFRECYHENVPSFGFSAKAPDELMVWRNAFRRALSELLGMDLLSEAAKERPLAKAVCEEAVREKGYVRHKYVIETLPGVRMPFYMLVPEEIKDGEKCRAMIAVPAHGASKETVAGVTEKPGVAAKLASHPKENYGERFAKEGWIVFCPDPPGYGERIEAIPREDLAFIPDIKQNPLGSSCKNLAITAEAFGFSFAALVIWDLMRLVDFIERQPQVDLERIGCAGFSGGGLYTMWLCAMDERVKMAVISGYIHGYYDSILDTHLCPCNYVPGLWKLGDVCDIAAMIAPRPMLIESGTQDALNGIRGIKDPVEQYEKIKRAYGCMGAPEQISFRQFDGPHMWWGYGYEFADGVWKKN